jgi:hypothetical protein
MTRAPKTMMDAEYKIFEVICSLIKDNSQSSAEKYGLHGINDHTDLLFFQRGVYRDTNGILPGFIGIGISG